MSARNRLPARVCATPGCEGLARGVHEHCLEHRAPKTIAYSIEKDRVGCILIQRMCGATVTAEDIADFDWEISDIGSMQVFPFNEEIKAQLLARQAARSS